MADDSGGHWKDLDEVKKLTQSMKVPGVFEEDVKRVNLVDRVPVAQAAHSGKKIEWLREKTTTEDAVADATRGTQLVWGEDIEYEEKETELKTCYIQRKLDHFVEGIYGTYNNYEARKLLECEKGIKRRIGARWVYGDTTYTNSLQMDGIHALAAEHGSPYTSTNNTNDPKNIDQEEKGLSLNYLRLIVDEMKLGVDEIWSPFEIVRRIDAAFQERGFTWTVSDTTRVGNLAFITLGYNELGKRVLFWDGIPIIRSDYLVAEQANTGTGGSSDARGLYSSGDKQYSIFLVKKGGGSLDGQNPGLTFLYGGTEGKGDLYKLVRFPELEDYDAGGIRMVSYNGSMLPSSLALGRIFDIEDVAITI
jgi:hypothetical protein